MKIHYKIASLILMLGFAAQANAQQHFGPGSMAQASVGVTIVEPLVVTKTSDMNFGSIIVDGMFTDVFLNPDGTVHSPFGASIIPSSGATAASFTVTGADLAYSIFFPMHMTMLENGSGDWLEIMNFVDSKGGASVVSSGSDTFTVGGSLWVPGMVPAGIYTGSFDVFVNYQ